jgi:hypothetical protein
MMGKHFVGNVARDLTTGVAPGPLPMVSIAMSTGIYSFAGRTWDCTEEGLYTFFNPANGTAQNRLAFTNFTGGADLYKILSGVCWNHVHGTDHNGLPWQTMSDIGRTRKWSAQCGAIAGLIAWLLPQCGFTARTRNPMTLLPRNGVDDGHIVLETLHAGQWRMWDLTDGVYYRDATGKHLSTSELVTIVNAGAPLPEAVQMCPERSIDSDAAGAIDLQIYCRFMKHTPEQKEAWVRRIYQSIAP